MGPLAGLRIIEMEGLGPGPFCAMMIGDHGAEVIRIARPKPTRGADVEAAHDFLTRSRKVLKVDLKRPEGVALVRRLCASADGLIEGYRPGVMERMGLGPETLLEDNPRLVYGRMTGWGQSGPYGRMAGHDIDFIALSGALHACGPAGGKPVPPMNLVGDFGGGAMLLAFGMLAAMLRARETGEGQVVDCAMVDGSALLMTMMYSMLAAGRWVDERGVNLLDSGAPFYDCYETADGKYVAIGAIEPRFYRELLERVGLAGDEELHEQSDTSRWPRLRSRLETIFRGKTRDEWCALLEGTDACFAPVLSMTEAPDHAHNVARGTFLEVDGAAQPAPAPRFSATPTARPALLEQGTHVVEQVLGEAGYAAAEIEALRQAGVVG